MVGSALTSSHDSAGLWLWSPCAFSRATNHARGPTVCLPAVDSEPVASHSFASLSLARLTECGPSAKTNSQRDLRAFRKLPAQNLQLPDSFDGPLPLLHDRRLRRVFPTVSLRGSNSHSTSLPLEGGGRATPVQPRKRLGARLAKRQADGFRHPTEACIREGPFRSLARVSRSAAKPRQPGACEMSGWADTALYAPRTAARPLADAADPTRLGPRPCSRRAPPSRARRAHGKRPSTRACVCV
eukprot:scaffold655_cov379-Prasinococcus_capsulatus_cf.AAC.13